MSGGLLLKMPYLNITTDRRFRVTPTIVKRMREMRLMKWTYSSIANHYKVSTATVRYWCNEDYRDKQRKKNAKYKSNNKKRYLNNKKHYKNFSRENCLGYIEKYVNTAKYKPPKKQYKLFGQNWQYWEKIIKKEKKKKTKLKID